jgi:hypothetical protein
MRRSGAAYDAGDDRMGHEDWKASKFSMRRYGVTYAVESKLYDRKAQDLHKEIFGNTKYAIESKS